MPGTFLTATWRRLVLVTYDVDPVLLAAHLPPGCVHDTRDDAPGRAFVSLVAFHFTDTRVLGIRWPGYVSFPEVNLRAYVRQGDRRGVCFVREFVPQRLVATMARWLYNEPYSAVPMKSRVIEPGGSIRVEHEWVVANRNQRIACSADTTPTLPAAESRDAFFKEQQWGFGASRPGRLIVYGVAHPTWRVYPNPRIELDIDFASVYGIDWGVLKDREPFAITFAEGSAISVSMKTK